MMKRNNEQPGTDREDVAQCHLSQLSSLHLVGAETGGAEGFKSVFKSVFPLILGEQEGSKVFSKVFPSYPLSTLSVPGLREQEGSKLFWGFLC